MIPKIIHYCWFGNKKIPFRLKRFIKTWKKYCPDFEIKLWNEDNYDINKIPFLVEAYKRKKWAFVSDYARVDILDQFGGIYLDTDVELVKALEPLLKFQAFAGFECSGYVAFGLGFGAERGHPIVKEIKDFYQNSVFNEEFMKNNTCPVIQTRVLEKYGLIRNDAEQDVAGFHVFPHDYFCPMNYNQILDSYTDNTISIHHFDASWFNKKDHFLFKFNNLIAKIKHVIKSGLKVFHTIG